MSVSFIPKIYKLGDPVMFDDSTAEKKYIIITPSNGNTPSNLNNGTQVRFNSEEDRWYDLSSYKTGITLTAGFITKAHRAAIAEVAAAQGREAIPASPAGVYNDRNANITLANLWWAHLFSSAEFRLGDATIETIENFGHVIETLAHLQGLEFREMSGEMTGFIPDEGSGTADEQSNHGLHKTDAIL